MAQVQSLIKEMGSHKPQYSQKKKLYMKKEVSRVIVLMLQIKRKPGSRVVQQFLQKHRTGCSWSWCLNPLLSDELCLSICLTESSVRATVDLVNC